MTAARASAAQSLATMEAQLQLQQRDHEAALKRQAETQEQLLAAQAEGRRLAAELVKLQAEHEGAAVEAHRNHEKELSELRVELERLQLQAVGAGGACCVGCEGMGCRLAQKAGGTAVEVKEAGEQQSLEQALVAKVDALGW